MITLNVKYNTAKIFTDNVEQEAVSQIMLLNQEFTADSTIRIMRDTHAGAGYTIGTTMTIHGKAVPYMVGGILAVAWRRCCSATSMWSWSSWIKPSTIMSP